MNKKQFAIAGILLAAASNSFALEQSWYGKVGFGTSDLDVSELEGGDLKLDNPTGFNLTLGYQVNPFVAVEGSYTDLGEASDSINERYGDLDTMGYEVQTSAKVAVSATTMSIGGVISTDANQPFSAGFKAGFHFWDAEAEYSYREQWTQIFSDGMGGYTTDSYTFTDGDSASDDGRDLYYGLVGTYRTGQWLVSLEHTVFQSDDADPSMTALSVGMQF